MWINRNENSKANNDLFIEFSLHGITFAKSFPSPYKRELFSK